LEAESHHLQPKQKIKKGEINIKKLTNSKIGKDPDCPPGRSRNSNAEQGMPWIDTSLLEFRDIHLSQGKQGRCWAVLRKRRRGEEENKRERRRKTERFRHAQAEHKRLTGIGASAQYRR
jgi:hypothetical protein